MKIFSHRVRFLSLWTRNHRARSIEYGGRNQNFAIAAIDLGNYIGMVKEHALVCQSKLFIFSALFFKVQWHWIVVACFSFAILQVVNTNYFLAVPKHSGCHRPSQQNGLCFLWSALVCCCPLLFCCLSSGVQWLTHVSFTVLNWCKNLCGLRLSIARHCMSFHWCFWSTINNCSTHCTYNFSSVILCAGICALFVLGGPLVSEILRAIIWRFRKQFRKTIPIIFPMMCPEWCQLDVQRMPHLELMSGHV